MFEPGRFVLFVAASWALIVAPGPDMLYVITRGMSHGRQAGVLSALGVIVGILVHTTAAALGLSVILQTSALAFMVIKFAGALYLLYLGIRAWFDKSAFQVQTVSSAANPGALFGKGCCRTCSIPRSPFSFWRFCPNSWIEIMATQRRRWLRWNDLCVLWSVLSRHYWDFCQRDWQVADPAATLCRSAATAGQQHTCHPRNPARSDGTVIMRQRCPGVEKEQEDTMSVDDRMWRFMQKRLGYSDDEMQQFRENPRNEDVVSKAALLMDKVIILQVVEAHGCNSRHQVVTSSISTERAICSQNPARTRFAFFRCATLR